MTCSPEKKKFSPSLLTNNSQTLFFMPRLAKQGGASFRGATALKGGRRFILSDLRKLKHSGIELIILAFLLDKAVMITSLDNLTVFKYHNSI